MVDKFSQHTSVNTNEKFAINVIEALDKSLEDIDDLNLQRLKKARVTALGSEKSSLKWKSLSVAASLIILLSVPFAAQHYLQQGYQDFEAVAQDVPYTSEEMDDIDMLMSLENLEDGDA